MTFCTVLVWEVLICFSQSAECFDSCNFVSGKWLCPWHYCNECGKRATSCCVECPTAFCFRHVDGNIFRVTRTKSACIEHRRLVELAAASVTGSEAETDVSEGVSDAVDKAGTISNMVSASSCNLLAVGVDSSKNNGTPKKRKYVRRSSAKKDLAVPNAAFSSSDVSVSVTDGESVLKEDVADIQMEKQKYVHCSASKEVALIADAAVPLSNDSAIGLELVEGLIGAKNLDIKKEQDCLVSNAITLIKKGQAGMMTDASIPTCNVSVASAFIETVLKDGDDEATAMQKIGFPFPSKKACPVQDIAVPLSNTSTTTADVEKLQNENDGATKKKAARRSPMKKVGLVLEIVGSVQDTDVQSCDISNTASKVKKLLENDSDGAAKKKTTRRSPMKKVSSVLETVGSVPDTKVPSCDISKTATEVEKLVENDNDGVTKKVARRSPMKKVGSVLGIVCSVQDTEVPSRNISNTASKVEKLLESDNDGATKKKATRRSPAKQVGSVSEIVRLVQDIEVPSCNISNNASKAKKLLENENGVAKKKTARCSPAKKVDPVSELVGLVPEREVKSCDISTTATKMEKLLINDNDGATKKKAARRSPTKKVDLVTDKVESILEFVGSVPVSPVSSFNISTTATAVESVLKDDKDEAMKKQKVGRRSPKKISCIPEMVGLVSDKIQVSDTVCLVPDTMSIVRNESMLQNNKDVLMKNQKVAYHRSPSKKVGSIPDEAIPLCNGSASHLELENIINYAKVNKTQKKKDDLPSDDVPAAGMLSTSSAEMKETINVGDRVIKTAKGIRRSPTKKVSLVALDRATSPCNAFSTDMIGGDAERVQRDDDDLPRYGRNVRRSSLKKVAANSDNMAPFCDGKDETVMEEILNGGKKLIKVSQGLSSKNILSVPDAAAQVGNVASDSGDVKNVANDCAVEPKKRRTDFGKASKKVVSEPETVVIPCTGSAIGGKLEKVASVDRGEEIIRRKSARHSYPKEVQDAMVNPYLANDAVVADVLKVGVIGRGKALHRSPKKVVAIPDAGTPPCPSIGMELILIENKNKGEQTRKGKIASKKMLPQNGINKEICTSLEGGLPKTRWRGKNADAKSSSSTVKGSKKMLPGKDPVKKIISISGTNSTLEYVDTDSEKSQNIRGSNGIVHRLNGIIIVRNSPVKGDVHGSASTS